MSDNPQIPCSAIDRLPSTHFSASWQLNHDAEGESVMDHRLSDVQQPRASLREYVGESASEARMVLAGDAD